MVADLGKIKTLISIMVSTPSAMPPMRVAATWRGSACVREPAGRSRPSASHHGCAIGGSNCSSTRKQCSKSVRGALPLPPGPLSCSNPGPPPPRCPRAHDVPWPCWEEKATSTKAMTKSLALRSRSHRLPAQCKQKPMGSTRLQTMTKSWQSGQVPPLLPAQGRQIGRAVGLDHSHHFIPTVEPPPELNHPATRACQHSQG